ncbi:MAG: lipoprotein signal peptidase [Prevotella sp.]|jgi:signal peptidase II
MKKKFGLTDGRVAVILIAAILIIDQIIKIAVKTHLCLGESIHITDWFYIVFVENAGMAFGIQWLHKIFLTLFRIVAVGLLGWYLHWEIKHHGRTRYIIILSLIVAGAAGNIFDCLFYGLIFSEASPFALSTFVSFGQGYAPFMMGKVVDMFYFPLIVSTWPEWMPLVGGQEFVFFSPVFNFADASISVGVILLIIFCFKDFERITIAFSRNKHLPEEANEEPNKEEKDEK